MPDTLSSLIAKLGDCPRTEAYIETPTEPSRFGKAHLRDLADAALLELAEKTIEARDLSICIFCGETMEKDLGVMLKHAEGCEKRPENRLLKRAEAAEAERDNLAAALRHENVNADDRFAAMLREAREGREQAEAENLQLKHDLAKFPPRRERIAALEAENAQLRLRVAGLSIRVEDAEKARDEAEVANLEERLKAAESDYFDVRGEVEKLRWMLDESYSRCHVPVSAHNKAEWLSDLESRWTAREEAGDDG